MNSDPRRDRGTTVTPNPTTAAAITHPRRFSANPSSGQYAPPSNRPTGVSVAGRIRPRTQYPTSTGTSVTESSAAAAIAYVFVKASGLNSRPSCASRVKTGMNDTVITRSAKKSDGPTSLAARAMISQCGLRPP